MFWVKNMQKKIAIKVISLLTEGRIYVSYEIYDQKRLHFLPETHKRLDIFCIIFGWKLYPERKTLGTKIFGYIYIITVVKIRISKPNVC